MRTYDPETIARIQRESKTWAIVGLSDDQFRPSYGVAAFLQRQGYRIIPVNPNCEGRTILGEPVHCSLADIAEPIDVVDVFRRSSAAGGVVDEAIAVGAKAVWMQIGVIDADAAQRAIDAGLDVVMDACPKIEFPRLARQAS
jgi:uncharacterized protein